MITIYSRDSRLNREPPGELVEIADHALSALYTVIERIEAGGGCAAGERARLAALRLALANWIPRTYH